MKTLKKVLSLVLVVAMIASMLIVGAAAAEKETSNYPVAADVISGIKVMEGDERGMRYGDTVTREEAAAIVCRVLLGDTAETLKTTTAPFADVAANRWSAGYIAYLKQLGIISGVSDTEFNPLGKVTGIAFAKMLLVAVGYGANGEFEGASWDINVITCANDNGVFAGTKAADLAAAAVREECMLYAFNALLVPTVKYNKTFDSYYTGTSALDPVTGDYTFYAPDNNEDPYYYTLAWSKFALCTEDVGTDALGRPTVTWTADGDIVADNVGSRQPTATFTGKINSSTLYSTLGKAAITSINKYIADNFAGEEDQLEVYVDGIYYDNLRGPVGTMDTQEWAAIDAGHVTNSIGGDGATIELYHSHVQGVSFLTVVVYYDHIGEVTKVASDGKTLTLKKDIGGETIDVESKYVDITGYEKGDYVLYTLGSSSALHNAANFVNSLTPAEYTLGTFTGTNFMGQPVFDGVAYTLAAEQVGVNDGNFPAAWYVETGVEYKLYTDSLGNLIYAEENDEVGNYGAYNYVYVKNVEANYVDLNTPDPFDDGENAVAMGVVYPDGGKDVLYHAVKLDKDGDAYITYNQKKYYITGNDELKINPEGDNNDKGDLLGWQSYTTNDAGKVTLKPVNDKYATIAEGTVTITKSTAKVAGITGYIADSSTVLTLVGANGTMKQYTGINNFPKDAVVGEAYEVLYTYALKGKVLESVTVYDADLVKGTEQIGYCVFQNDADHTNGIYNYFFYIDGVPTFVTLDNSTLQGGTPYKVTNTDGEWSFEALNTYAAAEEELSNVPDVVTYNTEAGMVNAGSDMFGFDAFGKYNKVHYNTYNSTTGAMMPYEWATIDTVDTNFFTTVETEDEDCVAGKAVEAYTYYYDENTKIYDCTATGSGAAVDAINEGDIFVAYVNTDTETAYDGSAYCEYIWIVG